LAGTVCFLVAAAALYREWNLRDNPGERLAQTPFEQAVCSYLDGRGDSRAMIAVPPMQWRLQERFGHPVTTDAATMSWIPYHEYIGPTIYKLYKDLYDVDITETAGVSRPLTWEQIWARFLHYEQVWARRDLKEWQELGDMYGFHYVLAPTNISVQLPVAIEGPLANLCLIPATVQKPVETP
jgi:hypothetical protein